MVSFFASRLCFLVLLAHLSASIRIAEFRGTGSLASLPPALVSPEARKLDLMTSSGVISYNAATEFYSEAVLRNSKDDSLTLLLKGNFTLSAPSTIKFTGRTEMFDKFDTPLRKIGFRTSPYVSWSLVLEDTAAKLWHVVKRKAQQKGETEDEIYFLFSFLDYSMFRSVWFVPASDPIEISKLYVESQPEKEVPYMQIGLAEHSLNTLNALGGTVNFTRTVKLPADLISRPSPKWHPLSSQLKFTGLVAKYQPQKCSAGSCGLHDKLVYRCGSCASSIHIGKEKTSKWKKIKDFCFGLRKMGPSDSISITDKSDEVMTEIRIDDVKQYVGTLEEQTRNQLVDESGELNANVHICLVTVATPIKEIFIRAAKGSIVETTNHFFELV